MQEKFKAVMNALVIVLLFLLPGLLIWLWYRKQIDQLEDEQDKIRRPERGSPSTSPLITHL